jgi:hypothetical protein
MSRALVLGGVLTAVVVSAIVLPSTRSHTEQTSLFEPPSRVTEPSPLCPWREPDSDMHHFFPAANRHAAETRILSGLRVELADALGRQPGPEENSLTLHRISKDSQPLGSVLTRRVKGEHGAIEIVLAVTEQGEVRDVRFQRLREPSALADMLQDPAWLAKFRGRTHDHGWESDDAGGLPAEVRISARAVGEGIRSLLILLAISERRHPHSTVKPHE